MADVDRLGDLVEPQGAAVLAGVENTLRSAELAGLLNGGFSGDLAGGYWRAFRVDFEAIRGVAINSLSVGEGVEIAGNDGFVAVELISDRATGRVVVKETDAGAWQVDMVATVGPALVGRLGAYLADALEGGHAATIRDAFASAVVPGLDAAVALDPANTDLVFEAEFLRSLVES